MKRFAALSALLALFLTLTACGAVTDERHGEQSFRIPRP